MFALTTMHWKIHPEFIKNSKKCPGRCWEIGLPKVIKP